MNRRTFIKNSAAASSLCLLPISSLAFSSAKSYALGYQLYSVRDVMATDPLATLQGLKAMGYQDFEIYGFDHLSNQIYGYSPVEFKSILDDLGLSVSSGHYGFSPFLDAGPDALKQFVDACIVAAKALGSPYITWPWVAPEQRNIETFKRMAYTLNIIGEQITAAGLGFAYHNHGFEFQEVDGQNGFDIILKDTDPGLVKLQMDMYWVMHSAKFTPKELVAKQPGRIVMWHIKDMDSLSRDYTELGNGSIHYKNVLPDPTDSGLEYFYIEQGGNFSSSSMQSAQESAQYFKAELARFL